MSAYKRIVAQVLLVSITLFFSAGLHATFEQMHMGAGSGLHTSQASPMPCPLTGENVLCPIGSLMHLSHFRGLFQVWAPLLALVSTAGLGLYFVYFILEKLLVDERSYTVKSRFRRRVISPHQTLLPILAMFTVTHPRFFA